MKNVSNQMQKDKVGLWIYPEGTRSHQTTDALLPFKKGAFHIAVSGGIPIVPVVISSYHNVYNSRVWRFDGGRIKIKGMFTHQFHFIDSIRSTILQHYKVLEPIETSSIDVKNIDGLVQDTWTRMQSTLKEISLENTGG